MMFKTISLGVVFALLASAAHAEVYFISQEQAAPEPVPAQSDSGVVSQKDVVQSGIAVVQKDVVQSESVVQKADVCGCDVACGACCDAGCGCGCDPCCCPAPWELWPRGCSGFKIGGWTQIGYHTEGAGGSSPVGPIGPGIFNDWPSVVQLHQAYVFMGKAAQNCGCGSDWGFQLDYVFGSDGQDAQAFGSDRDGWDTAWDHGQYYGHALPQVYAEAAYDDLKVKVGKFYSIMGYERVPAVQNFFYSHAFSMGVPLNRLNQRNAFHPKYNLLPYSHTGFLAEYQANCQLTLYGGWTAGWDSGFNQNGGGDTFLGGFSYDFQDNLNVRYSVIMGDFGRHDADPNPGVAIGGNPRLSDSDGYLHTIVVDWDVNCRLKCVAQSIYGDNGLWFERYSDLVLLQDDGSNGKVFGLSNYLLYTLNCQWAIGSRLEWLKVGGGDEYADLTLGANYRPCANVTLRPEVRMTETNGVGILDDQFTFGVDAIVTF